MKTKQRPLRLGSFELLESRALLAHAGLPQGMTFEMHEDRRSVDFNRGPRMEMHARSSESRDATSFGSARGPRDSGMRSDFSPPLRSTSDSFVSSGYSSATDYDNAPPVIFIPSVPVLIIITLPSPVPASTQFSEPLTSSVRNTSPQSPRVPSFSNPPSSNLQSAATPTRTTSTSDVSLNSLSVFSDTALKRVTSSDSQAADNTDSAAQATQVHDLPTREEQQSQQLIRQATANETALQTIEADEETNLIELDAAELLKRTKRKSARAATTNLETSPSRESALHFERRLPRAAELQSTETWLTPGHVEEAVTPINDDLIELLAAEQVNINPSHAIPSTPFTAVTNLQLEANLGFHQAAELTDAAIPVEAQPADVAAAALPAREAQ
jgi:hypothetical protein